MTKTATLNQEFKRDINPSLYPQTALRKKWWQVYGDTQLNSLIEKAFHDSLKLKVVEARYIYAKNLINSVSATQLPQISSGATLSREHLSAHYSPPPPLGGSTQSLFSLHAQMHYEFDFWHKRRSRILAAKYGAMAQEAYVDEMKLILASSITQLYLSWNAQIATVTLLEKLQHIATLKKAILLSREKSGLAGANDVNDAAIGITTISQQIQAHQRIIVGLKQSIAILGGFFPSFMDTLHAPQIKQNFVIPLPKKVYLNLLAHRPDIAVEKYIVLSHNEKINEAKALFYPNINLSALVGYTSFDLSKFIDSSSFVPMVGSAFYLPLFDNGARKANLQMQVSSYNEAVYTYNNLVIKAANETVSLLQKSSKIHLQAHALKKEIYLQKQNYVLAQERFNTGLTNELPALKKQIKILQSKLHYITLKNDNALLEVALIKALGGGYTQKKAGQ